MGLMRKLDSDVSVFLQQKNKFENVFVFTLVYSSWGVCVCAFSSSALAGEAKDHFVPGRTGYFSDMCNFGIKRLGDSCGIYRSTGSLIIRGVSAFSSGYFAPGIPVFFSQPC